MGSEDRALGAEGVGCEWVRTEGRQECGGRESLGTGRGHRAGVRSTEMDRESCSRAELPGRLCLCPRPFTCRARPRPLPSSSTLPQPSLPFLLLRQLGFPSVLVLEEFYPPLAQWSLEVPVLVGGGGGEGRALAPPPPPPLLFPELVLPFPQQLVPLSSPAQVSC